MAVIHRKDVESVARKMEAFAKDLPEQEQNVLGWILSRAESGSNPELSDTDLDAVSGGQALSSQLASSLGFGGAENESITVSWSKSFQDAGVGARTDV